MKKMKKLIGAVLLLCMASANAAFADYDPDRAIFALEFDGTDNTDNWINTANKKVTNPEDYLSPEGWFITSPVGVNGKYNFGYVGFKLDYSENPIDVLTKDKLVWETKIKFNMPATKLDGEYLNFSDNQLMIIDGPHSNTRACIKIKDGCLGYGGDHNGFDYVSDYRLKNDTWYTIKADLHIVSHNMEVYIAEEGTGRDFQGPTKGMSYNADWGAWSTPKGQRYIRAVNFTRNLITGGIIYMDYSRLWDEGFAVTKTSIKNGAEDVSADTGFSAEFYGDLMVAASDAVKVQDASGESVPTEITQEGNKFDIYFPAGLKYDEEYTITIPKDIENENADKLGTDIEIKFTTEEAPFIISEPKTALLTGEAEASVKVKNNGTADRTFFILTAVYDADGSLIKLANQEFSAKAGTTENYVAKTDVADGAKTVKAYVWNGFSIE